MILILDGRATQTKTLKDINLARQNDMFVLCLPRPSLFSLDTTTRHSFYEALANLLKTDNCKTVENHPGRSVTSFQVQQLVKKAYLKFPKNFKCSEWIPKKKQVHKL